MKNKIIILTFAGLCFIIQVAWAQQLPMINQQRFNYALVNPATTGAHAFTEVSILARRQWMGTFDDKDSPGTYLVNGSFRLLKKPLDVKSFMGKKRVSKRTHGNIGLGGSIIKDQNTHFGQTGGAFYYAYHFKLDHVSQFSLGLGISASQVGFNKEKLFFGTEDGVDPVYHEMDKTFAMDASVGAYYTRKQALFLGFSCKQLVQTFNLPEVKSRENTIKRHYFLIGGYRYRINNDLDVEPSFILRSTEQWRFHTDITLLLYHKNIWWGGVAYRSSNDFLLMLGVNYKKFSIGYSVDYGFGKVMMSSFGSHELMLSFKIGAEDRRFRYKSRYF
jgi:type IX secretion system PorP/SprF family membrane protein